MSQSRKAVALLVGLVLFFALLAAWLLWPTGAQAQTMMSCAQNDNFACLGTTEDVTGPWNFLGAAPMSFEGATADGFEINVAITDPTTPDKTFTIPNANSAAATATGLPCGAGNHISDFNVTTGVFTCSADSGGGGHQLLSATHTDTTASTRTRGALIVGTATAWDDLTIGADNTVLKSDGTDAAWGGLDANDIGAGDLTNAILVGTCTADPCTLAAAPASEASLVVWHRGVVMRVVPSPTPGVNEIDFTSTTVIDFGDANAVGSGTNAAFYFGVR